MSYVNYGVDPEADSHRHRDDVHYRLYDHATMGPVTICMQWFDYSGYDAMRIMTPEAYDTEEGAELALDLLRVRRALATSGGDTRLLMRALDGMEQIARDHDGDSAVELRNLIAEILRDVRR
jgi:hypothetical protein